MSRHMLYRGGGNSSIARRATKVKAPQSMPLLVPRLSAVSASLTPTRSATLACKRQAQLLLVVRREKGWARCWKAVLIVEVRQSPEQKTDTPSDGSQCMRWCHRGRMICLVSLMRILPLLYWTPPIFTHTHRWRGPILLYVIIRLIKHLFQESVK